jgi:hypothetical protein
LDAESGDKLWTEAIDKEVKLLVETFECFNILEAGEQAPWDHQKIPLIWTFAVKFDGRRQARLVAGGHVTDPGDLETSSGVAALESVRLAIVAASLMQLGIVAADVGNAFVQAFTEERVYAIAGPEFVN